MPSPSTKIIGTDREFDALLRGLTRLIWMAAFALAGVTALVIKAFF